MTLTLIIVASSIGYCFVSGLTGTWFYYRITVPRCDKCRNGIECYRDHEGGVVVTAALWPLVLPLALGYFVGRKFK